MSDKEDLEHRKYEILEEIHRISELLGKEQYSERYNLKLGIMTKQLENIQKAINAF